MVIIHEFELSKKEAEAFDIVREVLADIKYGCGEYDELLYQNTINALHYLDEFCHTKNIHIEGEKSE